MVCSEGWIGKRIAQCDCMAESSNELIFLKVCCWLDLSASFASYLVKDGEITVILQIPDLKNFFLVSMWPPELFFCTGLLRRRRWSIHWIGREVSWLPQETIYDQTSIIGCFLSFWCQRKK